MVSSHPNAHTISLAKWSQTVMAERDFEALLTAISAGSRSSRYVVCRFGVQVVRDVALTYCGPTMQKEHTGGIYLLQRVVSTHRWEHHDSLQYNAASQVRGFRLVALARGLNPLSLISADIVDPSCVH